MLRISSQACRRIYFVILSSPEMNVPGNSKNRKGEITVHTVFFMIKQFSRRGV
jgi:hypothetical protein